MVSDSELQLSKRYSVSFNDEQVESLDELSKRNGVSVSWLVRLAVDEFIERNRDQQLRLDFRPGRE